MSSWLLLMLIICNLLFTDGADGNMGAEGDSTSTSTSMSTNHTWRVEGLPPGLKHCNLELDAGNSGCSLASYSDMRCTQQQAFQLEMVKGSATTLVNVTEGRVEFKLSSHQKPRCLKIRLETRFRYEDLWEDVRISHRDYAAFENKNEFLPRLDDTHRDQSGHVDLIMLHGILLVEDGAHRLLVCIFLLLLILCSFRLACPCHPDLAGAYAAFGACAASGRHILCSACRTNKQRSPAAAPEAATVAVAETPVAVAETPAAVAETTVAVADTTVAVAEIAAAPASPAPAAPPAAAAAPAQQSQESQTSTHRCYCGKLIREALIPLALMPMAFPSTIYLTAILVFDLCCTFLWALSQVFVDRSLLVLVFVAIFLPTIFVGPIHILLWHRSNIQVRAARILWEDKDEKEARPQSFKLEENLHNKLRESVHLLVRFSPSLNWLGQDNMQSSTLSRLVSVFEDVVRVIVMILIIAAFILLWVPVSWYWLSNYVGARIKEENWTKLNYNEGHRDKDAKLWTMTVLGVIFLLPLRLMSGFLIQNLCEKNNFRQLKDNMQRRHDTQYHKKEELPYSYMSEKVAESMIISHAPFALLHGVCLGIHRFNSMPAILTALDSTVWWFNISSSALVFLFGAYFLGNALSTAEQEAHYPLFFKGKWYSDTPAWHHGEIGVNFRARVDFWMTSIGRQCDENGVLLEARNVTLWDCNSQTIIAQEFVGDSCDDLVEDGYSFRNLERPAFIQKGKEYRITQSCETDMRDKWFNECISSEDVSLYTNQDYAEFKGGVCSNRIGSYPDIVGGKYGNAGVVNFKIRQKKSVSISPLAVYWKRTSANLGGGRESWRYHLKSPDPEVHGKICTTTPEKCAVLLGKSSSYDVRQQQAKEIRAAGGSSETLQEALCISSLMKQGRYKVKEEETKQVERVFPEVGHHKTWSPGAIQVEGVFVEGGHHKTWSPEHNENALSWCAQRRRSSRRSSGRESIVLQSLDLSGHLPFDLHNFSNYDLNAHDGYCSDSEALGRSNRLPPESPREALRRQQVGISPPVSPKRKSSTWTAPTQRKMIDRRAKTPKKHRKDHVSSNGSTTASSGKQAQIRTFKLEDLEASKTLDPDESERLRADRLRGFMI